MFEYVYVWDLAKNKCAGVWYVRLPHIRDQDAPLNTRGPVEETAFDGHIKDLLAKYPEPGYLVDGGESPERDGKKAAAELYMSTLHDEEE